MNFVYQLRGATTIIPKGGKIISLPQKKGVLYTFFTVFPSLQEKCLSNTHGVYYILYDNNLWT